MKRILFITQNMDRTGSEMVLWHLINNLDITQYSVYVFCLKKGSLYNSLPNHVQKNVIYKASGLLKDKIWRTLLKVFGKNPLSYQLTAIHKKFQPDYWYVNTLAMPWIYPIANKISVKVVTHLHELLYAFTYNRGNEFQAMLQKSNTIIGCSDIVCKCIEDIGHPDVRLQYSFIDENNINVNKEKVEALKKQHGIKLEDFVWIISGATSYMKGFDYMLRILEEFATVNVKFLWIGKQFDDGLNYYIGKVAKSKFNNKLIFAGAQSDDYFNYMSIGHGLLLLSREESFSMVAIEAAFLGIPTVGFDVGIMKSFIKEDMGGVVDDGNLKALIATMIKWQTKTPDKLKLKNEALNYSVDKQISKFQHLLDNL